MGRRKKKDGEPGPEERRRVELPQAVWLLERMSAHDDPITREQLELFGRHPDGPILPDVCLESRRLPDGWGVHDKDKEYEEPIAAASSIAVRGDGVLAIAGIVRGVVTVFVGDERYEYPRMPCVVSYDDPEIIGFAADGQPVVRFSYHTASEQFTREHYHRWTPLDVPGWLIVNINVLADGSVMTLQRRDTHPAKWVVRRGETDLTEDGRLYCRFALANDGRLIGFWSERRMESMLTIAPVTKTEHEMVAGLLDEKRPYIRNVEDCIVTRDGIRFIMQHGDPSKGFVLLDPMSLDVPAPPLTRPGRGLEDFVRMDRPYHGHLQQLPDGRWVYESRTRRDAQPCIVIGKDDEQPGFAHVTRVFQETDGRWCYWGALGRHLYKMEIPPAEAADTPVDRVAEATQ